MQNPGTLAGTLFFFFLSSSAEYLGRGSSAPCRRHVGSSPFAGGPSSALRHDETADQRRTNAGVVFPGTAVDVDSCSNCIGPFDSYRRGISHRGISRAYGVLTLSIPRTLLPYVASHTAGKDKLFPPHSHRQNRDPMQHRAKPTPIREG